MRILGFSEKWPKLEKPIHTTFRFQRKDKDWEVGEIVQEVYRPRSKGREVLGTAVILNKEKRNMAFWNDTLGYPPSTEQEAKDDGFSDLLTMWHWLGKAHGFLRLVEEPMNKLTLSRIPPGELKTEVWRQLNIREVKTLPFVLL